MGLHNPDVDLWIASGGVERVIGGGGDWVGGVKGDDVFRWIV